MQATDGLCASMARLIAEDARCSSRRGARWEGAVRSRRYPTACCGASAANRRAEATIDAATASRMDVNALYHFSRQLPMLSVPTQASFEQPNRCAARVILEPGEVLAKGTRAIYAVQRYCPDDRQAGRV